MQNGEQLYTLVNEKGEPVYTELGMDGFFNVADSPERMQTFTKKIGWSQMMELAKWSQSHCDNGRIKVFPAKVTMQIEKIPIE